MLEVLPVVDHRGLDLEGVAAVAGVAHCGGVAAVLADCLGVVDLREVAGGASQDASTRKGVVDALVALVIGEVAVLPIRTDSRAAVAGPWFEVIMAAFSFAGETVGSAALA